MFDKCIKCNRMGESCVPNLMLLPFSDLMQWCNKRQKHLGWTNKALAEKSNVPEEKVVSQDGAFYAKPGGYVYEIVATWEDTGLGYHGSANYYVFIVGGESD